MKHGSWSMVYEGELIESLARGSITAFSFGVVGDEWYMVFSRTAATQRQENYGEYAYILFKSTWPLNVELATQREIRAVNVNRKVEISTASTEAKDWGVLEQRDMTLYFIRS